MNIEAQFVPEKKKYRILIDGIPVSKKLYSRKRVWEEIDKIKRSRDEK